MKRLIVGLMLAIVAVTLASPAFADPPSTNKNGSVLTFDCTRGSEETSFQAIGILQSHQGTGQLLDSTATVTFVQITSDGQVVFEIPGQLRRSDLWSCTIAEVPGTTALVFLTPRR